MDGPNISPQHLAIISSTGPQMMMADAAGLTDLYEWNDKLDYVDVRQLEGVELHQRGLYGLSKFTGTVAFIGGTATSLQAGYTPGTVANEFAQFRTWATTFRHGANTYRIIGKGAEIQPSPYLVTPMEAAVPFDATLEQLTMANRYQQSLNRAVSLQVEGKISTTNHVLRSVNQQARSMLEIDQPTLIAARATQRTAVRLAAKKGPVRMQQ